jgi:hypothetical protein
LVVFPCLPGVEALPNYVPFQPVSPLPLHQQFPGASDDALELLARMVALDPNRRTTGDMMQGHRSNALQHIAWHVTGHVAQQKERSVLCQSLFVGCA